MIRAEELVKFFGGRRALGPVSLEIDRGEAVGVLGLNGVGKTTLLRILATALQPSSGALVVDGVDAIRDPLRVRRRIGFLPQVPPLYPDMIVEDYLRFVGRLRGMERGELERRIDEVAEVTHINAVRDERVRHLSHGYRQRVGVAQAILHDPDLVILDEPTHGLDPAQVVEMRGLIRQLKERHTVVISSHNLPEIGETCDRLLVLDAGQVVAMGTEAELSARALGVTRIEVAVRAPSGEDGRAAVIACVRRVPGVRGVTVEASQEDGLALVIDADGDRRAEVCRGLVEAGYEVVRLDRSREKLETIFLQLVGARAA